MTGLEFAKAPRCRAASETAAAAYTGGRRFARTHSSITEPGRGRLQAFIHRGAKEHHESTHRSKRSPAARARGRGCLVWHCRHAGPCLEPPRGAVDHDDAQGRRHRLLHVQQLRAGPLRVRDADRQLPAAAGRLRRPELLQARPERALRDPHRQQRRRQGRHHLPVPLHQHPARHGAADRRQQRRDSADPVGPGQRRQRPQPQRQRDLYRDDGDAATGAPARRRR